MTTIFVSDLLGIVSIGAMLVGGICFGVGFTLYISGERVNKKGILLSFCIFILGIIGLVTLLWPPDGITIVWDVMPP